MRSDSQERRMAMIAHDQPYWAACARVAGMDEAGRGPLAGDVVAACVIMPSAPTVDWVDDSKKLSALRRDKVYEEILRTALYVGVGRASAQEIDEINILQATMNAMRRAAADAQANNYLIDAASIVAKVTRDRELLALDQQYPQYGFARHKGYGTAEHIAAIREHGPCPAHRMTFIRKFL